MKKVVLIFALIACMVIVYGQAELNARKEAVGSQTAELQKIGFPQVHNIVEPQGSYAEDVAFSADPATTYGTRVLKTSTGTTWGTSAHWSPTVSLLPLMMWSLIQIWQWRLLAHA
ncbi:MAG: hypothetical protein Q8M98_08520 [Candidatus Cloacimonadaceae bacterium]|nr:hypothetical protein [Candidatus Cloacimonadaceae bacterium]MDP3114806.1 hypothetical protein [Candidatus Cloacimonadaceae bacterium]